MKLWGIWSLSLLTLSSPTSLLVELLQRLKGIWGLKGRERTSFCDAEGEKKPSPVREKKNVT